MNNSTLYFKPQNEQILRIYMTVAGIASTLIHLLMFYMSTKFTPKSMTVYRYTVKNTTAWSLLLVIQICFILRPIPYFPLYVAKVDGFPFLVGSYWKATIQWYIVIIIVVNLNTAFVICYSGLFLFLTESPILNFLSQKLTFLISICAHLICTGFVLIVLNYFYWPNPKFLEQLMNDYPEFHQVIDPNNDTVFGFYPIWKFPLMSISCAFFAILVGSYFILGFILIVRRIFDGVKRPDKEQAQKFKLQVFFMLVVRCVIPMFLLTFPIITLSFMVCLDVRFNWNLYAILYSIILVHGFFNTIGTLVVFKPYRDGFTQWFEKGKERSSSILNISRKSTLKIVTSSVEPQTT